MCHVQNFTSTIRIHCKRKDARYMMMVLQVNDVINKQDHGVKNKLEFKDTFLVCGFVYDLKSKCEIIGCKKNQNQYQK